MKCPTCGRNYVPRKKLTKGITLYRSGLKLSDAARKAGISRQLLHIHLKKLPSHGGH